MFSHLLLKEEKEEKKEFYTKQSYENSCAAFACSVLFDSLLKNAGETITPKTQFIFETIIYSEIWSAPGQDADKNSCFAFLQKFIAEKVESYLVSDANAIAKIKPNIGEILFCVIKRSEEDRHVRFFCSVEEGEKTTFISVGNDTVKKLDHLPKLTKPKQLEEVLKIPLTDFRVDEIKKWYASVEQQASIKVFEYPDIFLKTLDQAITFCSHFPEHKDRMAKHVLNPDNLLMTDMQGIEKFCLAFPDYKDAAAQFVIKNAAVLLESLEDVVYFLNTFPQFKSQAIDFMIENNHALLGQDIAIRHLGLSLEDAPEVKRKLINHVLASDYVSAAAKRYIRKIFSADLNTSNGAEQKPKTDFFKEKNEAPTPSSGPLKEGRRKSEPH